MTSYSVRRTINARPEVVWNVLTDAGSYETWNSAVLGIEGEIAEGNKIALKSIVNPDRVFKLNVTDVEPPNRMVWWDGMPLGLFKGTRTFTVTPQGTGSEFHMEEIYTGLMAPMITRAIPDQTEAFEKFGDSVKAEAERRGG